MSEHREAAEQALVNAQRNPIMSAEQHFDRLSAASADPRLEDWLDAASA